MNPDQPIFESRRTARESIRPTDESLAVFLSNTEKECGRELHLDDLAGYRRLLHEIEHPAEADAGDEPAQIGLIIRNGVFGRSRYINAELPRAVEEFKYHLEALHALDFKSPMTLLKSLELEMNRLDIKQSRDLILMVKFQEMITGQKKIRSRLMQRYVEIAAELFDIALYVRNNMHLIEERCRAAAAMLSNFEMGREKERQMIEEIKASIKNQLKSVLNRGALSKKDVDIARREFTLLTGEISQLVRADAASLRSCYQQLADSTGKAARAIDSLLHEIEIKKNGTVKENRSLFRLVGDVLVTLVTNPALETGQVRTPESTDQAHLVEAVRKRMIAHLLDAVAKGRRKHGDRRSVSDRRSAVAYRYEGPERRSGKARRVATNRRQPGSMAHEPVRDRAHLVFAS